MTNMTNCPSCGRENRGGKFCVGCGSALSPQQRPPSEIGARAEPTASPPRPEAPVAGTAAGRGRWVPVAMACAAVLTVSAAAAILLVVLGEDPPPTKADGPATGETVSAVRLSAGNLYAPVEGPQLKALVPAGWIRSKPTLDGVQSGLTARSAQDRGVTVTLGLLAKRGGSLRSQAQDVRAQRRDLPRYREGSLYTVNLADRRPAWRLSYSTDTTSTVEYLSSACGRYLIVSGSAPKALFRRAEGRFAVVARAFQMTC